ncbi:MAG: CoB--CoM heterodisulfide reductase subunit B [archaeon]|nr:CoB--CoM heterodisulfide reductase subunit B [archaeon]
MTHETDPPTYSLYLGCVIPNRYPMTERATRTVLKELGIKIKDMEGASCCPAPGVFRSFDIPTWLTLGTRNLTIAEDNNADILSMCNGCYGTLLECNHTMKHNTKKRNEVNSHLAKINKEYKGTIKVKHLMEVLYKDLGLKTIQDVTTKKLGLKVAIHYGCHILKPAEIRPWDGETEDPKFFDEMVEACGCESVDYKDKLMCCGAGGGVRAAVKEVAIDFTRHKLEQIRKAGADCIVVCCPFCQFQLDMGQKEVNATFKDMIGEPFHIPIFYYTQLMGLSMGLNPVDLGLIINKNFAEKMPPIPAISQDKVLEKVYKNLGYDYAELLQKVEGK